MQLTFDALRDKLVSVWIDPSGSVYLGRLDSVWTEVGGSMTGTGLSGLLSSSSPIVATANGRTCVAWLAESPSLTVRLRCTDE